MIPMMNIIAWSNAVPWAEQRQVEQDLVISRAIVDLFSDPFLREQLRFRGGTALNKLHFPAPIRYSEDIDLVRTSTGPIKPIIDSVRERLEPWLGPASFDRSVIAPKLKFRVPAEDPAATALIRLKLEINTSETEAFDTPLMLPFRVDNPWFAGEANIPTFSRAEMLATKLRALLQRNKGRDLLTYPTRSTYSMISTRIGSSNVSANTFKRHRHRSPEPRPSNECSPSSTDPDS